MDDEFFHAAVNRIESAILLGIDVEELDMDRAKAHDMALWLASEGIK